jgi:hypothetical protein
MKYNFFSPSNYEKKNFNKKSLLKIIDIYNTVAPKKIIIDAKDDDTTLFKKINNSLRYLCGDNKYWLWCSVIDLLINKSNLSDTIKNKYRKSLKYIDTTELRPIKPSSWYKDNKCWLSNYDIINVMKQYANAKKYKYSFLGVFPIDFAAKSSEGKCLYNSLCSINISDYINKNKKFIGFITNLDKHDEPGSHWTSTFIIIDPKLAAYGAYYYDSGGKPIPSGVLNFLNDIKKQCEKKYPNKKFVIDYNKKRFQYKNTECGIFSILYQLRWINKFTIKDANFNEVIYGNNNINDDTMVILRNRLYRPNTNYELKKIIKT